MLQARKPKSLSYEQNWIKSQLLIYRHTTPSELEYIVNKMFVRCYSKECSAIWAVSTVSVMLLTCLSFAELFMILINFLAWYIYLQEIELLLYVNNEDSVCHTYLFTKQRRQIYSFCKSWFKLCLLVGTLLNQDKIEADENILKRNQKRKVAD